MKILGLLILFWVLADSFVFSQVSGTGTAGNPYQGDIINNTTWSIDATHGNTIYVGQLYIQEAFTLTINPGLTVLFNSNLYINGTLVVKPGSAVTAGLIYNAGAFILESDYSGIPSLIFDSYTGPGNLQYQLYLSGGYTSIGETKFYKWHYISTPTQNPISTSVFTVNTLDLAKYIESNVITDNLQGWVASDGYSYYDQGTNPAQAFNQIMPGNGYNYYCISDQTYLITELLNSQDVNVNLTCGTGDIEIHGFNLVGNPFPSSLNWDYLYYNDQIPVGIDDAIYFTVNDGFASYVGGIGQGGGTGTIPPMQGFFVKANENVSSFTLPAAARTHNLAQARYKGSEENNSSISIPIIRIRLENNKDSDDLVIRFDQKATTEFDKSFDAYKFIKKGNKIGIWSRSGTTDFSINGLPFPQPSTVIPVGLYASSGGTYKISSNEITIPENYSATIEDLLSHSSASLTKGEELTFYTNEGLIEDRFVIKIADITTGNPEIVLPDKKFSIYYLNGIVNIIPLTKEFENKKVITNIYSITGNRILEQTGIEFQKGQIHPIFFQAIQGIYIVEIKSGSTRYVEKIKLIK